LVSQLRQSGLSSTELIYPSYGIGYTPQPKKNQAAYVTFLAPQKRVEDFIAIARQLPEIGFYLIGRDTARINQIYDGYAAKILSNLPSNMKYVETRIRQHPDLLEQSKFYVHTSEEPGMGIAVIEALSAGCLPLAPIQGGAGEVLEAAGVGLRYSTIADAVRWIRSTIHEDTISPKVPSPEEVARKSAIFSQAAFEARIRDLIEIR